MRLVKLLSIPVLALSIIGCASESAQTIVDDPSLGGKADDANDGPLRLDISSNGKTIKVAEGREVIVTLPVPSNDTAWKVTSTDRSLGYPEESADDDGNAVFTWQTKGFLPLIGKHAIAMAYGPGGKTYDVTLDIIEAEPLEGVNDLIIPTQDDYYHFTIHAGTTMMLELPANPSAGFSWKVKSQTGELAPPKQEYIPGGPATGSGGSTRFTIPSNGVKFSTNEIKFVYSRGSETPTKKFDLTGTVFPALEKGDVAFGLPESTRDDLTVKSGSRLILEVPGTPGAEWKVVSTDRSFGYPESTKVETYEDATLTRMFFKTTAGPLRLDGSHSVTLGFFANGTQVSDAKFTFTIVP